MEFDGSFEDFQETKQLASARKTNLRNKLLKRKKVSQSAKSESASRKNLKKSSSSQPTFLAQNGTPVLKNSTLSTRSQQAVLDIAFAFSQPISSTQIAANSEFDNAIPHTQISNKQSVDSDENVANESAALNEQNCESVIANISIKSDHVGSSNDANTETVNHDVESHEIRCDIKNQENRAQSDQHSTTQSEDNPIQPNSHVASCSNGQPSLSQEADPIWQCLMCKESIASAWRDSHLLHCLKKFEHKKSTSVQNPSSEIFTCDICKLDITSLSTHARSEHVNRCLDCQIENIKPKNVPCGNVPSESELIITECPLCNRKCSSTQAKLAHVKKCSQALGIDVQSVIVALQLQKKHAAEKISLGLPLLPAKSTVPKTKPTPVRKHVKEPKSEADADVQLAKALSLSIKEDEKRKNLLERSAFSKIESLDCSADELQVQLQPPKNDQKPGGRKRKLSKKPIPLLLLRTEDERMKLLQERVSAIIVTPEFSEEPVHSDKPEEPSVMDVDDCRIVNREKDSALWNLCGKAGEKKAYYTLELMEFVAPCEIEPGSKLKSLSQIPGHCIYTQQPYDFTFSGTSQYQEKNDEECSPTSPRNTPTTQEMVDIIVEDNVSSDNEASQIPLDNKKDEFNSDGFLRLEGKSKMFLNHDSVISCLETLVNNTWMSDVNISVSDGSLVPAHKLLLMLRCPGLREELTNMSDGTLYWNDISNEECTNFLNFIYTGSSSWSPSMSSKMLLLIKRCKMKEFEELKTILDPNHIFIEDAASQQTFFPNADLQKENSLKIDEPFIVHDVSSSGHEDSSHEVGIDFAVTENSYNEINLGKSNSTFTDQFNFTSHNLSISSTHLQTIDLERNVAAKSPICKTTEHYPTVSKYFSDSNEEVDVECLEVTHISETKLSSGINQSCERESSPDLFICDSDDEIPSNQEIIFEKSNSNKAGSESSMLTLQPSCSVTNGFRTCNFVKSTAIVPSPTSPHSLSQSQRLSLSYSQDSNRRDINTTIQLCSSTDVSDCQQDKDVICITESKNNINHQTPCTKNPIIDDHVASHHKGDSELFKFHPKDSSFRNNTTMMSQHDKDSGAATISQIQNEENEVNCQTPQNKNPIDGGYVRSYRKGDPELFKLYPKDSSFWNNTTVMSPHDEDCGFTTISQIPDDENEVNCQTPENKNPIDGGYVRSYRKGDPELFKLHPEDSSFWNNTTVMSPHDDDCGFTTISQIPDDENEVNCQTPQNKNPIDGGYVRSYRKGDPELFKLHPEDSIFWNDTTVMSPHDEDCGFTTISQIPDDENEVNCQTPQNKTPIDGGYVRSYHKGDPELFKLHPEDSSFWNNTTVMSPHDEDCGFTTISQIQEEENEVNCQTPNKNPVAGGYVRSYRKGDPELFKLYPEDSSFWNNTTVMSSDEDTNAKTISKIQDENDEQFCEELCHISPSKEHISPMMNKSLSDANSFFLNTPVSTRKINGKTQNIGLRNENRDAAATVNECSSTDMNDPYNVLLNDSFFNSNTRLGHNQSEFHHKNSNSDDEITSSNEDNFPRITFQNPLFDEIAIHKEMAQTRTDPIDSEVCNILQRAPSQDINQQTYTIDNDSPIVLSSDDEVPANQQRPKSYTSSEIISSDSEDEVVQYNTSSIPDKQHHLTTESPCKSNSFLPTSQPVQLNIDTDEEEEQILPLHLRLQKLIEKEKEQEKISSQRDSPSPIIDVEGNSNELPFVSVSAPVQSSRVISQQEDSNECVEGRACTPDLHKQVKRLKNTECIISDSPITPLPDYQTMVTPEIKMALKKFGVRAVPRKKAVAILSHIYDETHPIVNASGDIINDPGTPHLQKTSSSQPCKKKQPTKKRKIASQDPQEHTTEVTSYKSSFSKKIKTSKKRSKSPKSSSDGNIPVSNEATENGEEFCGSQNSSKSDVSDMPEESFFESDEVFGSQKCENDSLVKTKIMDYIRLNKKLYSKILMYEPLNLSSFQQELKENGIKISATNLMNFLDEECITFTLPRSEKYKKKQQQRTQKFRKRMIEKQSQQCSQSCS